MRYYFFGLLFAATATFYFHLQLNERGPASYPNFTGTPELNPVAPTPRDLAAPENSSNPFSMKDIEDTYKGFLANETALAEQATASRARLQHYLTLRNNNPHLGYYVNASSQLLQAIQTEQNNLMRIEGQRQSNSMYAFQKINLLYLSIQVGLKPESRARVHELTSYLMHVNYTASSNAFPMTNTFYSSWSDDALLQYTPSFNTGTVNGTTPPQENDFIGPRLPETFEATAETTGTVAI